MAESVCAREGGYDQDTRLGTVEELEGGATATLTWQRWPQPGLDSTRGSAAKGWLTHVATVETWPQPTRAGQREAKALRGMSRARKLASGSSPATA